MGKQVQTIVPAATASLWMARVGPQRARLAADLIRGRSVEEANRRLLLEKMKSARVILKVLRSALANAQEKGVADLDRLFVAKLLVNEGPRIRRYFPRAQGRADVRLGRTSHIVLELAERASSKASGVGKVKTKKSPARKKKSEGAKG